MSPDRHQHLEFKMRKRVLVLKLSSVKSMSEAKSLFSVFPQKATLVLPCMWWPLDPHLFLPLILSLPQLVPHLSMAAGALLPSRCWLCQQKKPPICIFHLPSTRNMFLFPVSPPCWRKASIRNLNTVSHCPLSPSPFLLTLPPPTQLSEHKSFSVVCSSAGKTNKTGL